MMPNGVKKRPTKKLFGNAGDANWRHGKKRRILIRTWVCVH